MEDFDHILNWKLLGGSHVFPGTDGGTCINEAAIVAPSVFDAPGAAELESVAALMRSYRWVAINEIFSNRLDEAYAARERWARERLWRLSRNESDKNANGRRTAAFLMEKALAFQIGGMNSYRNRPRHEVEHQSEPPPGQVPIVQVNFGRPDKGWKVTDDFPEYPVLPTKSLPDHSASPSYAKAGFIGGEPDS